MNHHTKRLAAAAYDRAHEARRWTEDRVVFVGVELAPDRRKTLLGDVTLAGDPPEVLRLAIAETLSMLRIAWVALLGHEDGCEQQQIEATHAALQCELAAAEWAWSSGTADGHALGRTLARRREALRQAIANPRPYGVGLLLPQHARASELLPRILVDACAALEQVVTGADGVRGLLLREVGYAAIGAWRLREMEAPAAASAIGVCLERSTPTLPVESEERLPLRAAS